MPGVQTIPERWQACVERVSAGDPRAREELLQFAAERLKRLTSRMLRDFPGVRRWEETDDVFQNALLRLWRALELVTPTSTADLVRLASLQIRRELVDLARHYFGPEGLGANHVSHGDRTDSVGRPAALDPVAPSQDGEQLAMWSAFHEQVQLLEEPEREVFDLLWYHGLSQTDAAAVLQVSERTVQRRWQQARLSLHQALRVRPNLELE